MPGGGEHNIMYAGSALCQAPKAFGKTGKKAVFLPPRHLSAPPDPVPGQAVLFLPEKAETAGRSGAFSLPERVFCRRRGEKSDKKVQRGLFQGGVFSGAEPEHALVGPEPGPLSLGIGAGIARPERDARIKVQASGKVGRSLREKGQTLFYTRERLRHTLGREPQLSELAQETGMTVEEVAAVELANGPLESLQQETIDGLTLESTLGTDSPEEGMVEKIALREAIDSLPERERITILLRFFRGMTQEQAARILKVSQVQVSRLASNVYSQTRILLNKKRR